MKKGMLFIVSGPSGSGKGTVVRELVEKDGVFLSISCTTREPRGDEVDGVHYHFISREQFESLIEKDGFLEWAIYNGNYYGTPKKPIIDAIKSGRDAILEIEVQGAMKVRAIMPEVVLVMLTPPSAESLERRLRGRGDKVPESVIIDRLATAREEILYLPSYDYHIYNNDNAQDECVTLLHDIMQFENNLFSYVNGDSDEMSDELKRGFSVAIPNRAKYRKEVIKKFK